ncbi:creatininase family protein [Clostridium sp. Cult2]|uniref:creatininase family protein n=1 Tax=Clostridium sp. Cult2 TaxID=2079003 RepID=UPI001F2F5DB1|nr:creatininase family protein [Clostridium sp. Cult2]MCF6465000.1 creatininase [Clostridium sp. Cult2]
MRLAHISWKKAEKYFENNDTVIIATGSIESHGTHIALGTDTLIPDKILDMIEDDLDVMIAPTVPYGACDSLKEFPGTISLSEEGLYMIMKKIVGSLVNHGAKKFVFLNGHGGNISTLNKICLELDSINCLGTIVNWWLLAGELNPEWKGGHGGAEETSGVMAVNPDFVDFDAIEPMALKNVSDSLQQIAFSTVDFKGIKMSIPRNIKTFTNNGWIGPDHPSNASLDWGVEMLKVTSKFIVEYINEFKKIELDK